MNSLANPKTAAQSATIRASVEESRRKKAIKAWGQWRPGRKPRQPKTPNLPGESWWCPYARVPDQDAFYAEARTRDQIREAQTSRSYRAPDEMGVA